MDTQNNAAAKSKVGTLNINFPGQWFIVDVKVKIHINGKLHSTHSIKNGFSVPIPITESEMQIQVVLGLIKSTTYKLTGLDKTTDYDMKLAYSDTWGKFSKDYKLSMQGEPEPLTHVVEEANTIVQTKNKSISGYNGYASTEPANSEKPKWYNDKSKLGWSIIVWPVFLYGICVTRLVKRKTKQYVFVALLNIIACCAYIGHRHNNDITIPFSEPEPDYYGSMVATYDRNTSGADLQRQVDDYKSSNGECKAHEDWSARKKEFEASQYTSLPPLFLIYMIGSIGYTVIFLYRKRSEL